MKINDAVSLDTQEGVAVVTLDNPPVNALSRNLREGLKAALDQSIADKAVRAIVIICAGRTFIAGADIKEFGKPPQGPSLAELNALAEDAPKPIVAAVHGTALGGGFEFAMACHYRVALLSAKFGLPEIKLGLIPGGGGTQRLPRLVGLKRALSFILTGEQIGATAARELGAVDEIVSGDLRNSAIDIARRKAGESGCPERVRDQAVKIETGDGVDAAIEEARTAHGRRLRGVDAFEAALSAVRAAAELSFEEGLARERELFVKLLNGTQAKAQRYLFTAERAVEKIPDIPAETPTKVIRSVGIVGAGTMGGGIAMNFLNAGMPVTIVEMSQEALVRGLAAIRRNYEASAKKGRMTPEDVANRMGLLTGSLALDDLADCDLVIEAVFETMEVKRDVFGRLDRIVKDGAILASNTSYLDINEIAAATRRPESVLGLHFFSPANVMKLVEVVRGEKTDSSVIHTAMQLAKKIGKTAVLVGVCHGFVGNRMLAVRQREANKLILEGAMPWDVDRVLTDFGMPMGPFQMADLAGLDLGWSRETSTGETIRERLCEADRRGQKTGAGFYDYDENRRGSPSKLVEDLVIEMSGRKDIERRAIADDEILKRCIYPMINEGFRILEERIALRASDIDVVWVKGYGWPAYRGGPMFYADTIGRKTVLETMRAFEMRFGEDFRPAASLERAADA